MDYQKDVNEDAVDFILEYADDFQQAIINEKEFDRNDIKSLDESFHCDIGDRGYSLTDAAYVIENCENEETDSGLWEGKQPEDALSIKAAYSYSLDVWFKCEEIYNGLVERFNEIKAKIIESAEEEENEADDFDINTVEIDESEIAEEIFIQLKLEHEIKPVEDTKEQIELIEEWLRLNANAGSWSGYPVGASYIDSRCGVGYGMPEVKDFVDFDRELAQKIPTIAHKLKKDVQTYLDELKNTVDGAKHTFLTFYQAWIQVTDKSSYRSHKIVSDTLFFTKAEAQQDIQKLIEENPNQQVIKSSVGTFWTGIYLETLQKLLNTEEEIHCLIKSKKG